MSDAPPARIELVELPVAQAQAAFASGAVPSEALTQAFLDRIAEYNPHYNANLFMSPDALAYARAIDCRRAAGEALGPLAGVPIVVKDPMDIVGFPTTPGWRSCTAKTGGVDLMPGAGGGSDARGRCCHSGQDERPGAQSYGQPCQ